MNQDELPERERITVRYGDYEYTTIIQGKHMVSNSYIKNAVMAHVHHALIEFHGSREAIVEMNAKLTSLLYTLASRYPNVAGDFDFNNFARTGEVD